MFGPPVQSRLMAIDVSIEMFHMRAQFKRRKSRFQWKGYGGMKSSLNIETRAWSADSMSGQVSDKIKPDQGPRNLSMSQSVWEESVMCNTTGTEPEMNRCAPWNHEKLVIQAMSLKQMHIHTLLYYIPMYSLPDLINRLIILAIFIGWHIRGTIIGENTFWPIRYWFWQQTKRKASKYRLRPSSVLFLLFCLFISSSVDF